MTRVIEVPVDKKINWTVSEASAMTGVGMRRIYKLAKEPGCKFVLHVGGKILIRRKQFIEYLETIDDTNAPAE